jgi:phenylpropionate dioxygenase-like ring-hydroxylating dioxygenase large terminal subunit
MVAAQRVVRSIGTPVEKAPEPDLGNEVIPSERYKSRAFMEKEWDRMWTRVWLMGCHVDEIPEPGDYTTTDIGDESILIVRGHDGVVRAFYNVCSHRGNQLKFSGDGSADTILCAYHLWEYDLTGRLIHVPDADDFPSGCPVDRLSLKTLRADVWGGHVWFNMDPDCEPLRDYLGVIPEHLDPYRLQDMAMMLNVTMEWDCNWKTAVDAFNEVYHVQGIHPELMYDMDDMSVQIDLYDRHNRYLIAWTTPSQKVDISEEVPPILAQHLINAGANPDDYRGRVLEIRNALQRLRRERGREKGIDFDGLNDDQMTDDYHYFIFPNVALNLFAEHVLLFRQRPHETDPNRMYFDVRVFHPLPKGAPKPPVPEHATYKHGEFSLGLVVDQDSVNLPHVQKGLRSRGFEGLWISNRERRLRHMHATLMSYIGEDA